MDVARKEQGRSPTKHTRGFEPQPLSYEYLLVRARRLPEVNPSDPRYRWFIRGWQRVPLGVSRLIGPWLARGLA
jgi:hypothetical protein